MSYRDIERQYNLNRSSLYRHYAEHLPAQLVARTDAKKTLETQDLHNEMRSMYERINRIADACDEYLTDPDRPGRYYLGPRDADIEVIYTQGSNGTATRSKARLSELLERVEAEDEVSVVSVRSKYADPRKLLLDAAGQAHKYLELYARMLDVIRDQEGVRITNNIVMIPGEIPAEQWGAWAQQQLSNSNNSQ